MDFRGGTAAVEIVFKSSDVDFEPGRIDDNLSWEKGGKFPNVQDTSFSAFNVLRIARPPFYWPSVRMPYLRMEIQAVSFRRNYQATQCQMSALLIA